MTELSRVRSEALAGSHTDAYEQLFNGHFWVLVRLAQLLGADDPEDVVQDAFVRLYRRHATLRDPNSALAYLRSIVCNLSRSRLRHLRMARRRHAQLVPPGLERSAEHEAVHGEDVRRLLDAVSALPHRQREALVLRFWMDLSEQETASALGVAVGTVKSHTARALASLAKKLEDTE